MNQRSETERKSEDRLEVFAPGGNGHAKDALAADLKSVVSDAESLMKSISHVSADELTNMRDKLADQLRRARLKLGEAQEVTVAKAKQAAQVTEIYVTVHPWKSMVLAVAAGTVIGYLLSHRRASRE